MNTFFSEEILSHNFDKVAVNVTVHNTLSASRSSQVVSLEQDTKIFLRVFKCFNNSHKVVVKIGNMGLVMLLLVHYSRFPCSCDVMVDFGFH